MSGWPGPPPRVIGHRGAAADAPENTLAGLRRAAALGLAWVEVDARLTADDLPVMMHDETLARTGGGLTRRVRETPAWQVARCDAGAWFGAAFAGEPVPTLTAALDLAAGLGLAVNVELKPDPDSVRTTGEIVGRHLAPWHGRLPLLVSCFDGDCLAAAAETAPDLPRALNTPGVTPETLGRASALGCCAVHMAQDHAHPPALAAIRAADMAAGVFTVNEPDAAAALFAAGADYLFTDDPDALASFWRE